MSYAQQHLNESIEIIQKIDVASIEKMADLLAIVKKDGGRIFFLGVGGSAGNCSHAVNDFRKIVGIESYAPTDNVSELTARTNDEGWPTIFVEWLKISKLSPKDMIFIFSVGGGNLEKNISPNLVEALKLAKSVGSKVVGVVGRDGGYTAQVADACVIIPTVNSENITPHSEAFQGVVWHLLVSHPKLKANQTKWESAVKQAMRRAVFLDRDGVINRAIVREGKPFPPSGMDELEILPGVEDALEKLHAAGYLLIVVTNQPDVARGTTSKEAVEQINSFLDAQLPIDEFRTCYHDSGDGCNCRKPLPGALLDAAREHEIDLSRSFMVGDRWRDIEAGSSAGCKTFFINYRYNEQQPEMPDFIVSSLFEAKKIILGEF